MGKKGTPIGNIFFRRGTAPQSQPPAAKPAGGAVQPVLKFTTNYCSVLLSYVMNHDSAFMHTGALPPPNRVENSAAEQFLDICMKIAPSEDSEEQPDYKSIDSALMLFGPVLVGRDIRDNYRRIFVRAMGCVYRKLEENGYKPITKNIASLFEIISADESFIFPEDFVFAESDLPSREDNHFAGKILKIEQMAREDGAVPASIDSKIMSLEIDLQLANGNLTPQISALLSVGVKYFRHVLEKMGYTRPEIDAQNPSEWGEVGE